MFFSKGITLESKNLALSEIPRMMETGGEACKPDNAIIFNVGVLDVQSLPGFSNGDAPVVISLALLADGYHTQLLTMIFLVFSTESPCACLSPCCKLSQASND
mmetsp:Transcript_8085/g.11879  ORF Transcript_8085/g.11879 Transcript_8085/m.11879 type:complete len:103 (-) Transcript_8085:624-932(-)